jgi:hypothetical protein
LWLARAATRAWVEVVLAVDADDDATQAVGQALAGAGVVTLVTQPSPPYNAVRGWNCAAQAARGQLLLFIADDVLPPKHWDEALLKLEVPGEAVESRTGLPTWLRKSRLVKVDDGAAGRTPDLVILTQARYRDFGYAFFPEYESVFSDADTVARAELDGAVILAKHLRFEHLHPSVQKRPRDEVHKAHEDPARRERAQALWRQRRKTGCLKPGETSLALKFAAYVMANKDDFCLLEACQRAADEGVRDFFFCVNSHYWSGKPVTPAEVAQVQAAADALASQGLQARLKVFQVDVAPGLARGQLEAKARQAHLAWLRGQGYFHLLPLAGDTLWAPGCLKWLRELVVQHTPDAVMCRQIDVAGVPGLPADNSLLLRELYLGNWVEYYGFHQLAGETILVTTPQIYHFGGTRASLAALAAKFQESPAVSDPAAMAAWVQANLAKFEKPAPGQALPNPAGKPWVLRAWTPDELACLPPRLLGQQQQLDEARP